MGVNHFTQGDNLTLNSHIKMDIIDYDNYNDNDNKDDNNNVAPTIMIT